MSSALEIPTTGPSIKFSFTYCNFSLKYFDAILVGVERLISLILKVVYTLYSDKLFILVLCNAFRF